MLAFVFLIAVGLAEGAGFIAIFAITILIAVAPFYLLYRLIRGLLSKR
ncbi:MAG: hypothetical protein HYT49_03525 [Candidatus Wildermuthbacteria bacterium]|nr:hypothetical protein [Candidatus Wildermuthbacteria bacterium]